jgi:hypothetical protein
MSVLQGSLQSLADFSSATIGICETRVPIAAGFVGVNKWHFIMLRIHMKQQASEPICIAPTLIALLFGMYRAGFSTRRSASMTRFCIRSAVNYTLIEQVSNET